MPIPSPSSSRSPVRRVFVNSGTSLYEAGPERLFERSTAAHNTVEVDGENSSEVWDAFRVARRARPFELEIGKTGDAIAVACAHDGYRRLRGKVTHRRKWLFRPEGFSIEDQLEGGFAKAKSFLHLHPDIQLSPEQCQIRLPGGRRLRYEMKNGSLTVADYSYHPEFGLWRPARCLEVAVLASPCTIRFSFE